MADALHARAAKVALKNANPRIAVISQKQGACRVLTLGHGGIIPIGLRLADQNRAAQAPVIQAALDCQLDGAVLNLIAGIAMPGAPLTPAARKGGPDASSVIVGSGRHSVWPGHDVNALRLIPESLSKKIPGYRESFILFFLKLIDNFSIIISLLCAFHP